MFQSLFLWMTVVDSRCTGFRVSRLRWVSILVLVDDGRRPVPLLDEALPVLHVSILVLVDDGRRPRDFGRIIF